jgi:hypothetical protein
MIVSYKARRRLKIGPGHWREPDEPLPEAHLYFRLESYLHTGYVSEVELSEADLLSAIERYCPELRAAILARLGIAAPQPSADGPTPAQRWALRVPLRAVGPAPRAGRTRA